MNPTIKDQLDEIAVIWDVCDAWMKASRTQPEKLGLLILWQWMKKQGIII